MTIEQRIHRRVGKALREHNMIEEGDRILIAVSGGKDSSTLARILTEKQRYLPVKYELFGCHTVDDFFARNEEGEQKLDQLFQTLGVPLIRTQVSVLKHLDQDKKMNCFFCAMMRRKAVLGEAQKRSCNKVAYGHHLDDVIETLLMNMFYKAEISTMPARLELSDHDVTFIRPLCYVKEREIITYAERYALTEAGPPCPFGEGGRRARIKRLISELAEEDPKIRDNLSAALGRVKLDYLKEKLRGH